MNNQEKIENCYRQMQSKAAFIRAVEDGTLNYYSANHQRMETKVYSALYGTTRGSGK